MKIAIDCRHADSSGVGSYARGCLPHFLDSPHTFLLIGDSEKLKIADGRSNTEIIPCTVNPFSPRELFAFPPNILKKINNSDLFYSPYFNIPGGIKVPIFVTIHDIIFPDMPELVSRPGLYARMFYYRRASRRAKAIFTVSEFSKSRIEYHMGTKTKIINASNAVSDSYLNSGNKGITKKNNILFIGNIKKHKGLKVLIEAFLCCKKKGLDYQLVIVGSKDNFRSSDKESAGLLEKLNDKDITFTGFIPEEEKNHLLAESDLLVQPSLYEGFSYPPLEAMLSGTPALVSDIPVFREVYGDFPVGFFRAGDSEDLAAKMMKLLYGKESQMLVLPDALREKYSFHKITRIILEEFKRSEQ